MGSYYYHTNNKDFQLAHSHYSDPAFKNKAVIFGTESRDLQWEYADRLRQWEPQKAKESWQLSVDQHGKKDTARRIETYLRYYFDDQELEIVCIVSGTQPYNGYPWYAYGFRRGKDTQGGR